MAIILPSTVHDPSVGGIAPATWGDAVNAAIAWLANMPAVRTTTSATQSLTNNVITDLTYNVETAPLYDTDAMHSIVTNTDRITIVTPGLYTFTACREFAGNATGHRTLYLTHSGGTIIGASQVALTGSAVAPILTVTADYRMAAGEWMRTQGWQTSGGALIVGNSARDHFSARFTGL